MGKKYRKFKKWAEQKKVQEILNYLIVFWIGGFIAVGFILFNSQLNMAVEIAANRILGNKSTMIPLLTPIPTQTQANKQIIISTPTPQDDRKVATPYVKKEQYYPSPTASSLKAIDSDPIVSCNFKINGSKRMKSSECSKSFECQINKQWYIYTSREQCTQDQNNYWSDYYKNSNTTIPTSTAPNTNSNPIITCQSRGEDLVIQKSICDSLVDCQIGNQYFLLPPSDCTRLQAQHLQETGGSITSNNSQNQQQNNTANNQQCKSNAQNVYQGQHSQAISYGGTTGTGAFIEQQAQAQYNTAVSNCDALYPL